MTKLKVWKRPPDCGRVSTGVGEGWNEVGRGEGVFVAVGMGLVVGEAGARVAEEEAVKAGLVSSD